MILNVSLRDISSYAPGVNAVLGPLKKINLIYGQNGTGKTTIGNFLQATDDPIFHGCRVDGTIGQPDIVVYNQSFVESNFNGGGQPGIFTLNQGNIEAEKTLAGAEATIKKLTTDEEAELRAGQEIKSAQEALEDTLKEGVWAPRRQAESTSLRYCLQGTNTKDRLLEKVKGLVYKESNDTFECLAAEVDEINKASDHPIPSIRKLTFSEQAVEKSPLFQERITASDDSYLSALILKLGNSDWVKHSFYFFNEHSEQCPLCQQSLPDDFYHQLQDVFDTTYEERLRSLETLRVQYQGAASQILSQIEGGTYPNALLNELTSELKTLVISNLRLIDDKLRTPSTSVELVSTAAKVTEINALITVEQARIDTINERVREKSKHLGLIADRFWNCYRGLCDEQFKYAEPKIAEFVRQRTMKREAITNIRRDMAAQGRLIADAKSQITNIDQAVGNINRWLGLLGLQGFQLVREEGEVPRYRLQRPEAQEKVFKTLSEGEKTLISFLYFLEVCNGELDVNSTKIKADRIVVIDDPISSLSHNYVYDVATLIRREVLLPANRFKQVLVLTHNLFFFHELIKLVEDDRRNVDLALFKVSKSAYSVIHPLRKEDIKNDYQAFWHTLKDALEGKASPTLIPNMMRNILEYYFSFVQHKDRLWKALDDLAEANPNLRAFYRYINRESHSDPVNITEFGDINAQQYLEQFRQVFVATQFEDHFNRMMA
ncbi:AAA family ATPase [Pseudomonas capsici]|uniref:AAA family ATPase n=1 Tax=Pseudomonas capsici TaxID=2810614 RepID=UPI0021F0EFAA|nr:AAA family ATPase [Pseudomonas capsici]MCV4285362.1 AAA family ATPase [Pseudomonas capsici]